MASFTISELADAAGVAPRTVRFYTAEGLLPPPDARGRYALYSDEHLDRLRFILRSKEAYLPLGAIRDRLQELSRDEIHTLLGSAESRPAAEVSRRLAAATDELLRSKAGSAGGSRGPIAVSGSVALAEREASESESWGRESEAWQRILLAPNIELQVRLPVSEITRERIERLVTESQRLFPSDVD